MKRIATFLLLTACLIISLHGYAQKFTITQKNASLRSVFNAIEKQSDYVFFVDADWLQLANPVNINVRNASLLETLDSCFKDQPLTYTIIDKTISIRPKDITAI